MGCFSIISWFIVYCISPLSVAGNDASVYRVGDKLAYTLIIRNSNEQLNDTDEAKKKALISLWSLSIINLTTEVITVDATSIKIKIEFPSAMQMHNGESSNGPHAKLSKTEFSCFLSGEGEFVRIEQSAPGKEDKAQIREVTDLVKLIFPGKNETTEDLQYSLNDLLRCNRRRESVATEYEEIDIVKYQSVHIGRIIKTQYQRKTTSEVGGKSESVIDIVVPKKDLKRFVEEFKKTRKLPEEKKDEKQK